MSTIRLGLVGVIGAPVRVNERWNMRKHASYYEPDWRKPWKVEPIFTHQTHDFDLLRYLCGDIESVSAETSNIVQGFEKEDAAAIAIGFKDGVLGTFILSDQSSSTWSGGQGQGNTRRSPLVVKVLFGLWALKGR